GHPGPSALRWGIRQHGRRDPAARVPGVRAPGRRLTVVAYGALKTELVLEPVTGKALPVLQGEVLRMVQEDGEQCVDLNAFNLHDYKECMSISSTRSAIGFRIGKGDLIWTIHSRDRPMYLILELSEYCVTDLLGGRCRAASM